MANKYTREWYERRLARLWKAASLEMIQDDLLKLCKDVEKHEERCAIAEGSMPGRVPIQRIESGSFALLLREVLSLYDEKASIAIRRPTAREAREGIVETIEITLRRPELKPARRLFPNPSIRVT